MRTNFSNHALRLFLSIATVVVLSREAAAQDVQQTYFVQTNDGSMYQGQLVENVVGQHVTIKLATGDLRTFQASDVKTQGSNAIASTTVSGINGLPGAPPVAYSGPDAVQVHITKSNNGEGTLFMETPSGWQPACTMPCTTTVNPKIDYRLHNTDAFRFPAGAPLDLVAGSSGRRVLQTVGWSLVSASLLAPIAGILVQAGAFSDNATPRTPAEQTAQDQQSASNRNIGFAIYGISAAVLTVGIVLLCLHPSSTLATTNGQRIVKAITRGGFAF